MLSQIYYQDDSHPFSVTGPSTLEIRMELLWQSGDIYAYSKQTISDAAARLEPHVPAEG